ncbi:MAG: hypothetical protein QM749_15130 [Aquabacterium sp.]
MRNDLRNDLTRRARRALPVLTTLALAVACLTQAHAELPHYTVSDLPSALDGISAQAVSASGDILGSTRDSLGNVRAALVHDGVVTLLPQAAGANFTTPLALNDQGMALAIDYTISSNGLGNDFINNRPYLYAQGTQTWLPMLADGNAPTYSGLNNRGDLLGSVITGGGGDQPLTAQAFIYHSGSGQFEMINGLSSTLPSLLMDNADRVYSVVTNASGSSNIVIYASGQLSSVPGTTFSGSVQLLSVNDAGQMLYTTSGGLHSSLFFYDKGQSTELGFTQVDLSNGGYNLITGGMRDPFAVLPDGTVLSRTMLFKDGASADLSSLIDTAGGQMPGISNVTGEDAQGRILFSDGSGRLHWLVPTSAVPEPGMPAMVFLSLLALAVRLSRQTKKAPEGALLT